MTAQPEGWSAEPDLSSPDTWWYGEKMGVVYDGRRNSVAKVYPDLSISGHDAQTAAMHANGHRIASLSAENARLREALETALWRISRAEPFLLDDIAQIRSALRAAAKGGGL